MRRKGEPRTVFPFADNSGLAISLRLCKALERRYQIIINSATHNSHQWCCAAADRRIDGGAREQPSGRQP